MMKRILIAVTSLIIVGSNAQAADIEAPVVFDWTGFYAGPHLRYGDPSFDGVYASSESRGGFPEDTTYADDIKADGILGGVQAGYNFQVDGFLAGVEADIS